MSQKNPLTWFITGCSSGFGRELTKVVLACGYRAVVTARNTKQIEDLVAGYEDRTLALRLDVTDPAQVAESVRHAEEYFGGIDVLVNNAGIGYFAAVEESVEKDIRRMFEIDFFGLARMIHAVLPGMRKRRRGHISSTFPPFAGWRRSPASATTAGPSSQSRVCPSAWPRKSGHWGSR